MIKHNEGFRHTFVAHDYLRSSLLETVESRQTRLDSLHPLSFQKFT